MHIPERACTQMCTLMQTTLVSRKRLRIHGAHNTCLIVWPHSPQKMHMHPYMRVYATVQKLPGHENYCELILSLAQALYRLSFAACPAAVSTKSVARRCSLKKSVQIHASSWRSRRCGPVSHKHHSIIVLVQASSSLVMVSIRDRALIKMLNSCGDVMLPCATPVSNVIVALSAWFGARRTVALS